VPPEVLIARLPRSTTTAKVGRMHPKEKLAKPSEDYWS
jgi:hypothetical protein